MQKSTAHDRAFLRNTLILIALLAVGACSRWIDVRFYGGEQSAWSSEIGIFMVVFSLYYIGFVVYSMVQESGKVRSGVLLNPFRGLNSGWVYLLRNGYSEYLVEIACHSILDSGISG